MIQSEQWTQLQSIESITDQQQVPFRFTGTLVKACPPSTYSIKQVINWTSNAHSVLELPVNSQYCRTADKREY